METYVIPVAPDLTFFSIWEHYVGGRETHVYKNTKVIKKTTENQKKNPKTGTLRLFKPASRI